MYIYIYKASFKPLFIWVNFTSSPSHPIFTGGATKRERKVHWTALNAQLEGEIRKEYRRHPTISSRNWGTMKEL